MGLGFSATGFLGLAGGSGGVEVGIAIPTDFFKTGSLRGAQIYGSGSVSVLSGLGGFFGVGPSGAGGYSSGPIESGFTSQNVVQGGAAWGVGGEASAPVTKSGFAGGASASGAGKYGYGLYGAGGIKLSGTAATAPLGCQ